LNKSGRPISTITLSLLSCLITIGVGLFDSSLYSFDGSPLIWLSFMPESPLRAYGLSLIFSPFLHLNMQHLLTNLFFFIPISMMIEKKRGSLQVFSLFFVHHFLVLILLTLGHFYFNFGGAGFLGMSHILMGLITYWSFTNRHYWPLLVPALFLLVGTYQDQASLTLLAHIFGVIAGLVLFIGRRLR
jgi:membrane associated rhomboid family serine protease